MQFRKSYAFCQPVEPCFRSERDSIRCEHPKVQYQLSVLRGRQPVRRERVRTQEFEDPKTIRNIEVSLVRNVFFRLTLLDCTLRCRCSSLRFVAFEIRLQFGE